MISMDLPPEILTLAKASPWALVACFVGREILRSPFASILAIRFARNDKERSAYLADRHLECRLHRPRRNQRGRKEKP